MDRRNSTAGTDDTGSVSTTTSLDVGFVPAECPGTGSAGATRTSELLIRRLSRHHDMTVYVASQATAPESLPASDRVEYVLHDDLPSLPHPLSTKLDALREEVDALETHDLVHTYSPGFIPVLADLSVPTISTLNSYLPVCPKGDLLYHDGSKCDGPSTGKCVNCIANANLDRRQGLTNSLRAAYSSLGKIGYVDDAMAATDDIDAFQAISPHIERDYADFGIDPDKITVVPHFYDDAFYRPPGNSRPDAEDVTLLFAGRLKDNKGPQILIRALPLIIDRGYDVTLKVAGTGSYAEELRELATDLGVADVVEWLGYVDHDRLPDHYAAADAFVFPGLLDEPFGRVLLEALATHTPIVASDVGSTDYIVGDAGEIVEPGDPGALAEGVDQVLTNYETHVDAIPSTLRRFDPESVVAQFLDLYARVADRSTKRPVTA
ncbi:glycosyltransferase family 4 protein [Halorientalis sp. IM1011]|uniref:glycosyltransferase family 4 protein n=1 Tax=Halorientalis sp. IM1011 TaxID=1932360 RepID=UPI000A051092|nr:glycosyltransferase family 4 protein [Halorientalis sp. IM1011]